MVKDADNNNQPTTANKMTDQSESSSVSTLSGSPPATEDSPAVVAPAPGATTPAPEPITTTTTNTVLMSSTTYEVVRNHDGGGGGDGTLLSLGGAGGASGVEGAIPNGLILDSASTPGAAASPPGPAFITTTTPHQIYNINNTSNNTLSCPVVAGRGASPTRYSPAAGGTPNGDAALSSANPQQHQQHVVHVHVNLGETFSVRIGDQIQHIQDIDPRSIDPRSTNPVQTIQGPATVRMVSNNGPPLPMPMQVPPGHMVQQIVDENGILTHVILSPQPQSMPPGPPPTVGFYGSPSGGQPQQLYGAPSYGPSYPPYPSQYPPHHHPPHQTPAPPPPPPPQAQHLHSLGVHNTPPPSHCSQHIHTVPHNHSPNDDGRKQRQKVRLQEKLQQKRQRDSYNYITNHAPQTTTPPRTNLNGDMRPSDAHSTSSSSADGQELEEERKKQREWLGAIKQPKVADIESRSALILLTAPEWPDSETPPSDFKYELLLSEKRDAKFKRVYNGDATEITLKDLKPATEYYLKVSCILEDVKGEPTEPVSFRTDPCEPDAPAPPKLLNKSKTWILLKWTSTTDNGSKVSSYTLEYNRGPGEHYEVVYSGAPTQRQYKVTKLTASSRYCFRLAAVNAHGKSKYSDPIAYYTSGSAPSQPDPPMCSDKYVKALTISWIKRPNDDEFTLQMEDTATGHGFLNVYKGPDLSYKIRNLRRNTEYKYRLQAGNEEGGSKHSDVVCYRTLPDRPAPPAKLAVKGKVHSHSFRLTWDHPKDNGGSDLTAFILEMNNGRGFCPVYHGLERELTYSDAEPGTTYVVQVACVSQGGQSEYSDPLSVTTLPVIPGPCPAPKLHGKPKATSLQLRWGPPLYEGGAPITDYDVVMINSDNTTREVYRGREPECVVAGLLPGRPYLYQVRALNKAGAGPWSASLEIISGPGVPDPPKMPVVTCRSPHSALVSWEEPVNNGARISEYRLEWQARPDAEFVALYSGPGLSHELRGGTLSPASTYSFRVQALNVAGAGPFSAITSAITPPSSPGPVTAVRASATATAIHLVWKAPAHNGAPILAYNVSLADRTLAAPAAPGVLEYTVSDLTPETAYKVRIQAANDIGVGPASSPLKVVTRALPPSPPRLECANTGPNSLKLKWGDGKNPDLVDYCLEMLRDNGSFHPVYHGRGQSHKVNKLAELTDYQFRVCAINAAGSGPYSAVTTCSTTKAPPPAVKNLKVCEVHRDWCRVEWSALKAMGRDTLVYTVTVQRASGRDQESRQVYHGPELCARPDRLSPHTDYTVRVCATRRGQDPDPPLAGPPSPPVTFSTPSSPPRGPPLATPTTPGPGEPVGAAGSLLQLVGRGSDRPLSDQQWAVLILIVFAICAGLLALLAQQIIAYTSGGPAPAPGEGVGPGDGGPL